MSFSANTLERESTALMPQACGIQGSHSIFEKSVSLPDDKGAFTVSRDGPREWVELGYQAGRGLVCCQLPFSTISGAEQVPTQLKARGDTGGHR